MTEKKKDVKKQTNPDYLKDADAESKVAPNNIQNIISKLQETNSSITWHNVELPSNGSSGYDKKAQIREMTTSDEKLFIKELYTNRDQAIGNILTKCVKLPNQISFLELTNFDQDFLLVELSAITFPGKKQYEIEDDEGNKIKMEINKEELTLDIVEEEIPMKIELEASGLTWYLGFLTVSKSEAINKLIKDMKLEGDILMRMLATAAIVTNRIEITKGNVTIEVSNWFDYIKLLEEMKASDVKALTTCVNDNIIDKYGYKLTKEVYSPHTMTSQVVEVDPLNFFRLSF